MKFNELRYQDPKTKTYLGSPSLARLDDGDLLATHDYFGPGCPRNHENEEHLTSVYRSRDQGRTWSNVTHVANAYWSTLFVLGGDVYLIGTSQQYGSIVIRRSTDGGYTWSYPRDAASGMLFQGGPFHTPPNYHCAPVPVLIHNGRLYRAFEDDTAHHWPRDFQACVVSADVDADLLNAANWTMSQKLQFDPAWVPKAWGDVTKVNWLEGNVVLGPHGRLWNVLRVNLRPRDAVEDGVVWNKAALVNVEEGGRRLSFDPANGFVELPGGHSKFTIRYDARSDLYLTLSNGVRDVVHPTNRAVLSLYKSATLRDWQLCAVLLKDDSGLPCAESIQNVGFQYVDWQFDGDDLIYLVRTAYDGAHNFHDANRITFHRLKNFREVL